MKCPYILDKVVSHQPGEPKFRQHDWQESTGDQQSTVVVDTPSTTMTHYVMHECLQEGCAAWLEGTCSKNFTGADYSMGIGIDTDDGDDS